ncbi:superoxide dismutase [archaeon]|nr:superoxide dismutase [archaeon]|tara:strand:+ start:1546 stop:2151 length:606 start_codon:yes stop_codon:yes gene_type:complete
MTHTLPELGYEYNALEPHFDEKTMIIHHTKHHQTYIDKLNAALENNEELKSKDVIELLKDLNSIPEDIRTAIRNHGGGHFNHSFWWPMLKRDTQCKGEILEAINTKFESFEKFKEELTNTALTLFGSGWAWLVVNNGELEIVQTSNQDSPISEGKIPILGIDMWEHAAYLRYQNRKPDYVEAFFNVINWDQVNENYLETRK